jgi:hypothetical protein
VSRSRSAEQIRPVGAHEAVRLRFRSLLRAGYPEAQALDLAIRGDVKVRVAADLLSRGCPLETAVRILR